MSVYFITARELGRVKIGRASNPTRRLWELQTASSSKLQLEAVIPGDRREERELHTALSSLRIRGEWFHLTPQIEELIATGVDPSPAPEAPSKKMCDLDDEPWFAPSQLRQMEKYAEAMAESAAEREARANQLDLGVDAPARKRAA